MADFAQSYNKKTYKNIYSHRYSSGISVIQPEYQTIPDGSIINNPAYVSHLVTSFWTYKFIIDSSVRTGGIESIAIPICYLIKYENIKVYEKIDCCSAYKPVTFTLIKNDPCFYYAPKGFQWLKIQDYKKYPEGVCIQYLLEIMGNYPNTTQSLKIKTIYDIVKFTENKIIVPGSNPIGSLAIRKRCCTSIINNQAILKYVVDVLNTGNTLLKNVNYNDKVYIPNLLSLGKITVNPSTLSVDLSIPGQVLINGCLGIIKPGQMITTKYSIPIIYIAKPRIYKIDNIVKVSTRHTSDCTSCSTTINAVKLNAENQCSVERNKGTFTFTISNVDHSPDTSVNIMDYLYIPSGITLKFKNFGGCTAVFDDKRKCVPLDTNIIGPKNIIITCRNVRILEDSCIHKTITFTVISSKIVRKASIVNTLKSISLAKPESQILLGTENLPITSTIDVLLNVKCK